MISCLRVAAAVEETTPILDSCSLKETRRVWHISMSELRLYMLQISHLGKHVMVDLFTVSKQRHQSLQDLELYFDALRQHCPDGLQYERHCGLAMTPLAWCL